MGRSWNFCLRNYVAIPLPDFGVHWLSDCPVAVTCECDYSTDCVTLWVTSMTSMSDCLSLYDFVVWVEYDCS